MTPEEIRHKLATDEDYIPLKRFDYSLKKLLERYPDGVPDRIIAQSLLVEEEQVEVLYQEIVTKLQQLMKV
jgi:hypothetical protein